MLANFFCEDLDSTPFQAFWVIQFLLQLLTPAIKCIKTAIDNMQKNGHYYVPIQLCSLKQVVHQIWPAGCSLPTIGEYCHYFRKFLHAPFKSVNLYPARVNQCYFFFTIDQFILFQISIYVVSYNTYSCVSLPSLNMLLKLIYIVSVVHFLLQTNIQSYEYTKFVYPFYCL